MRGAEIKQIGNLVVVNGLVALLLVLLAELLWSSVTWLFFQPADIWLFEQAGRTVHFHPVKGYHLTPLPSRFTRITHGIPEYVGTLRGNAQGFPDQDDFARERARAGTPRLAVFGDSYTAGQYLSINWPDRTEELSLAAGQDLQLLNLSTDGGGLANWESNLRGFLKPGTYAIDGLVFAVYGDDLRRKFSIADARHRRHYAFTRVVEWAPESYPKDGRQARNLLDAGEIGNAWIVTKEEFDAALRGHWHPPRPWECKVLSALRHVPARLWRDLRDKLRNRFISSQEEGSEAQRFSAGQLHLMDTLRDYVHSQSLPVMVVYIPGRAEAAGGENGRQLDAARAFADYLGAAFIDGREAFEGRDADQLAGLWFQHDQHWNQKGSDVFATFMAARFASWPQTASMAE